MNLERYHEIFIFEIYDIRRAFLGSAEQTDELQ